MIWVLLGLYLVVASAIWASDKSWETLAIGLLWPVWVVLTLLEVVFS